MLMCIYHNEGLNIIFIFLLMWTFLPLGLLGICYQSFTETCLWKSVRSVAGMFAHISVDPDFTLACTLSASVVIVAASGVSSYVTGFTGKISAGAFLNSQASVVDALHRKPHRTKTEAAVNVMTEAKVSPSQNFCSGNAACIKADECLYLQNLSFFSSVVCAGSDLTHNRKVEEQMLV